MYEQALAIEEKIYGSKHLQVGTTLMNFAGCLQKQASPPKFV